MKKVKENRWTKDIKEDRKLMGLIEVGAASLDKKPDTAWLTFGTEFPRINGEQFERALDHIAKRLKRKEAGTHNA